MQTTDDLMLRTDKTKKINLCKSKWLSESISSESECLITKKTNNHKTDGSREEHREWEWKQVQPLWKSVWRLLPENRTTADPATPLLGTLPKDACTPMFINALFTTVKT